MFSKSCRKALIKCGINPDDFGTFDQRADAQGGARKQFREEHCAQLAKDGKKHPPPCKFSGAPSSCTCFESAEALDSEGAQEWIYLNSQSGHLSQNCFYQAPGKRADPCSNIRPSVGPDGKQNSGGYGYRDNDALCMDHIGLKVGQEHYWICRGEQAHRESLGEDQPVSEAEMERGVENTARIVVDRANSARGQAPDVDDDLTIEGGGTVADRAPEGAAVDKCDGPG